MPRKPQIYNSALSTNKDHRLRNGEFTYIISQQVCSCATLGTFYCGFSKEAERYLSLRKPPRILIGGSLAPRQSGPVSPLFID